MRELVDDLRARLARVRQGGSESARKKHTDRGKLLARDRVDRLLDAGSPFLEIAPLAAYGMYGGGSGETETSTPSRPQGSSRASAGSRDASASSSRTTPPSRAAPTTR